MEAQQAILAGALLNAELMAQRDDARAQVQALLERIEELESDGEKGSPEVEEVDDFA